MVAAASTFVSFVECAPAARRGNHPSHASLLALLASFLAQPFGIMVGMVRLGGKTKAGASPS